MAVLTAFVWRSTPLSRISQCLSPNKDCYQSPPSISLTKRICFCSSRFFCSKSRYSNLSFIKSNGIQLKSLSAVPEPEESEIVDDDRYTGDPEGGQQQIEVGAGAEFRDAKGMGGLAAVLGAIPEGNSAVISACLVGLLTGIAVVVFNNGVHEIRDFFWDGIPYRGASWLREEPIELTWGRIVLVPVCGGLLVGVLNAVQEALENRKPGMFTTQLLQPLLKSMAACITLGTGNSLGPEGPSVEIGSSVAEGVGTLLDKTGQRKVSLVAAGSAAGISSGFSAAVSGCFFGVESVLWPSPSDSPASLTNTTSMIILSAVIASVVSEIGLGSEPAFKVPDYDFRSPSELPLYLLLGGLCGLVSLALSRCTSYMLSKVDQIHEAGGIPRSVFPVFGGLSVGLMALAYPEILYWGFENVDILLESRPFVKGLSADLLLQLVAVKIVATSLCRACGLVGGYYAPSLFIGAATGMVYGKFIAFTVSQLDPIFHLRLFEVASPQAYGLVGMSATLAGVCQVPLTSVLLLFELTQDYRIVLPLLGAVGLSSWITSLPTKKVEIGDWKNSYGNSNITENYSSPDNNRYTLDMGASNANDLLGAESSPCLDDFEAESEELERRIHVSQAMRTRYATVLKSTLLTEAVTIMLAEKQSYALVIDSENITCGVLLLAEIQEFSNSAKSIHRRPEELLVAEICAEIHYTPWAATPDMDLLSAKMIMMRHNLSLLPVVSEHDPPGIKGQLVGIIDRECIRLACRAVMTKERLEQK